MARSFDKLESAESIWQGLHDLLRRGDREHGLELADADERRAVDAAIRFEDVPAPRFDPAARRANRAFVELLERIAGRKQTTPAQIALAWLLAQKRWIVPIPGTTKLHRLEENIGVVDVELTAEDLREIEEAPLSAEGARYADAQQRMIDR